MESGSTRPELFHCLCTSASHMTALSQFSRLQNGVRSVPSPEWGEICTISFTGGCDNADEDYREVGVVLSAPPPAPSSCQVCSGAHTLIFSRR